MSGEEHSQSKGTGSVVGESPGEAQGGGRSQAGDTRSERTVYTRMRGKSPEGSGPTWPCLVWLSQRLCGGVAMCGQIQHPVRTEGFAATQGRDVAAASGVPGHPETGASAGSWGTAHCSFPGPREASAKEVKSAVMALRKQN